MLRDPLPAQDVEVEPVSLHPDDHLLLAELARDGRASYAVLAAALHWHESTMRRRIEELQQQQQLYFDVDLREDFLNARLAALLWLAVEPAHLDETGRAIARHPEVPFAAATTGHTNLVVSARFRGTRHMYHYITARLTGLSGIRSLETSPIIGRFKQAGPATPGLSADAQHLPMSACCPSRSRLITQSLRLRDRPGPRSGRWRGAAARTAPGPRRPRRA